MYVLKLALRPWRQAWVSQVTSVFSVGFMVFACTLLIWLERGLNPVIHRLKTEQVLTAYLVPTVPVKDEAQLRDSIRTMVGSSASRTFDVKLTNGEEFLKELTESYPQLAAELADLKTALPAGASGEAEAKAVAAESDPILPRYITVSGILGAGLAEKIRAVVGIESVETSEGHFRPLAGAFSTLQWLARFLAVGLLFALIAVGTPDVE